LWLRAPDYAGDPDFGLFMAKLYTRGLFWLLRLRERLSKRLGWLAGRFGRRDWGRHALLSAFKYHKAVAASNLVTVAADGLPHNAIQT